MLTELGFANVHAERVVVPVWARTSESGRGHGSRLPEARADRARRQRRHAGGRRRGRGRRRARRFDELEAPEDAVRGKIVFFDVPMERTRDGSGYGGAVVYRSDGPSRAAKLGAVAVLVRSIGTDYNRLPHTGALEYATDAPKIPAAALSIPDADLLARLLARGRPVRVRLALACGMQPDAESANVIGEVPGSEAPGRGRPPRRAPRLVGPRPRRHRRRRGLRHRHRGRAADRGAPDAPAPHGAGRALRQRGERPRRRQGLRRRRTRRSSPRHAAALEADSGTGRPLGLSWNAGPSAAPLFAQIAGAFSAASTPGISRREATAARTSRRCSPAGVPLVGLAQDASTYFDFHHTANDTFDKIVPEGPRPRGRGHGRRRLVPGRRARPDRPGSARPAEAAVVRRVVRTRGVGAPRRSCAALQAQIDPATAERFAKLALACVDREYPNKPDAVLDGAVRRRADGGLHPGVLRLLRLALLGPRPLDARASARRDARPGLRGGDPRGPRGAPHRRKPSRPRCATSTSRARARSSGPTAGRGRCASRRSSRRRTIPRRARGGSTLEPLEDAVVARFRDYLPKLTLPDPQRHPPEHRVRASPRRSTTRARPGARTSRRSLQSRASFYYGQDRACPLAYEPSGEDFFSPCLAEADLMRRVLLSARLRAVAASGSCRSSPRRRRSRSRPRS